MNNDEQPLFSSTERESERGKKERKREGHGEGGEDCVRRGVFVGFISRGRCQTSSPPRPPPPPPTSFHLAALQDMKKGSLRDPTAWIPYPCLNLISAEQTSPTQNGVYRVFSFGWGGGGGLGVLSRESAAGLIKTAQSSF